MGLLTGFTSRPPTIADVEEVTDLINRRSVHDIGSGDETVERIRMFWEEPERNLATDCLVVLAPTGEIVAQVDFDEYAPYDVSGFSYVIDPAFTGIGIEEFLFAWSEERWQRTVPKAPTGAAIKLETQVWESNEVDQERLRQAGYRLSRVWYRMQIEMDELPPDPNWPDGIVLETLGGRHDVDAVHAAWEDAQRDEWGFSSLTNEQFHYYFVDNEVNFDPTLWFLATDDTTGEIAGYVLGRLERPGEPEVGHIRYVAVRRQYRRRGLAGALLLHSFREYFTRGKRKVSLAVDSDSPTGAQQLYLRVGMQPIQQSVVYEKELT